LDEECKDKLELLLLLKLLLDSFLLLIGELLHNLLFLELFGEVEFTSANPLELDEVDEVLEVDEIGVVVVGESGLVEEVEEVLLVLPLDELLVAVVESESLLFSLLAGVGVSGAIRPSFIRFFCFIRLFWNQILTCVSFNWSAEAISILLARVKYLLKWNSFSSSVSCFVLKLVRPVPPANAPYSLLGAEKKSKNSH